jgi:hypothetical protein
MTDDLENKSKTTGKILIDWKAANMAAAINTTFPLADENGVILGGHAPLIITDWPDEIIEEQDEPTHRPQQTGKILIDWKAINLASQHAVLVHTDENGVIIPRHSPLTGLPRLDEIEDE